MSKQYRYDYTFIDVIGDILEERNTLNSEPTVINSGEEIESEKIIRY